MSSAPPPTIAFLRAQGVDAVRVFCTNRACGHVGIVQFDALGAPEETRFIDLARGPPVHLQGGRAGVRGWLARHGVKFDAKKVSD